MPSCKLVIASWTEFCPVLIRYLDGIGYNQPSVVIRHFNGSRLPVVLKTGTDRDASSMVWAWDGDVPHARQRTLPRPQDILYAWTIDLARMVRLRTNPVDLSYLQRMPQTAATALYDPTSISRDSEYEYHFLGSPRDALLGVLSPLPADKLVRVAKERHAKEKRALAAMNGTVERIVVPVVDMYAPFVQELEAKIEEFP